MTTALSVLDQRLHEAIGDWIEEAVTTAVAASTSIVSTNLKEWDNGRDDFFNTHWAYITDKANAGVERKIYDYATATGTCSVRGSNLTTDGSDLATVRFYRYPYTVTVKALNDAIRDLNLKGICQNKVDDRSLISGNNLPDGSFEDWTSSSALRFYTALSGTLVKTTTAGLYRGPLGTTSAKYTAGAGSDYISISSNTYPWLLDLMGHTIDFKCWAYPEVANDAFLQIYTLKADGTAQTLTSTTTCPATKWTLLSLTNQAINDDIVRIDFRFGVTTNAKYVYFDSARVTGKDVYEYRVPYQFQNGEINQVFIQTSGDSNDACDDLAPSSWAEVLNWEVRDNGTHKFLYIPSAHDSKEQLRLIGTSNLESLSAFTDTIGIDGPEVNPLIAYTSYKLFLREEGLPAGNDPNRFRSRAFYWYSEYLRLKQSLPLYSTTQITPTP